MSIWYTWTNHAHAVFLSLSSTFYPYSLWLMELVMIAQCVNSHSGVKNNLSMIWSCFFWFVLGECRIVSLSVYFSCEKFMRQFVSSQVFLVTPLYYCVHSFSWWRQISVWWTWHDRFLAKRCRLTCLKINEARVTTRHQAYLWYQPES